MNVNEKIDRYLSEGKSKKFTEANKWIKTIKKEVGIVEKLLKTGKLEKAYGAARGMASLATYLVKVMTEFEAEDRGESGLSHTPASGRNDLDYDYPTASER